MSNESYAYLLNVEPSNLVFLKTYNTKFDQIIHNIYRVEWYTVRNRR